MALCTVFAASDEMPLKALHSRAGASAAGDADAAATSATLTAAGLSAAAWGGSRRTLSGSICCCRRCGSWPGGGPAFSRQAKKATLASSRAKKIRRVFGMDSSAWGGRGAGSGAVSGYGDACQAAQHQVFDILLGNLQQRQQLAGGAARKQADRLVVLQAVIHALDGAHRGFQRTGDDGAVGVGRNRAVRCVRQRQVGG